MHMPVQGGRPGLDDVSSLDAVLHSNLLAVKSCPPEQVEHLCLTFAAEQQLLGKVRDRPEYLFAISQFSSRTGAKKPLCQGSCICLEDCHCMLDM
jgi:hypothetical protein